MDVEKKSLLLNVENLKSEIRSQSLEIMKLTTDLSTNQKQALASSSQLRNTLWKIKQADFVRQLEKERRERYYDAIRESKDKIQQSSITSQSEKESLERSKAKNAELNGKKIISMSKLTDLRKLNSETKTSVINLKHAVNILKSQNSATMRKLLKRKEEVESEERDLKSQLGNLKQQFQEKIHM